MGLQLSDMNELCAGCLHARLVFSYKHLLDERQRLTNEKSDLELVMAAERRAFRAEVVRLKRGQDGPPKEG